MGEVANEPEPLIVHAVSLHVYLFFLIQGLFILVKVVGFRQFTKTFPALGFVGVQVQ